LHGTSGNKQEHNMFSLDQINATIKKKQLQI